MRDLLLRCFEKDPKKRIKIGEVRDHPWFSKAKNSQAEKSIKFENQRVHYPSGVYKGQLSDGKRNGKLEKIDPYTKESEHSNGKMAIFIKENGLMM